MKQMAYEKVLDNYRIILSDWLPEGASIAIAIKDTYVYFASGHANIALKVGEKVPENSVAYRVLTERKKIDAIMDTSLFETPYYAVGYPIEINDEPSALVVVLPPLFQNKKTELSILTCKDEQDEYIPIKINDIQYFESLQKRTWVNLENQSLKSSITLKELQTRLPSNFIRIHRAYIVNIYAIARVTKDFVANYIVHLKNGTELPVSQSYAANLRKALEM